jgi:hypothetical protein
MTVGKAGINAYRGLEREQARLSANLDELRNINRGLQSEVEALRSDPDTIAVYARELGYGQTDERFVRIVGLPASASRSAAVGQQLALNLPPGAEESVLRWCAGAAGLLVLAAAAWAERRRMPS